jgi:plasmid stabilization system protein ParE
MTTAGFRLSRAARADLVRIRTWYMNELGPAASAKTLRSIEQALLRLQDGVSLESCMRPDLPLGVYRVVAKRHLVLFEMRGEIAFVLRVVHAARDLSSALEES